jgi:hypothetical protein
MKSFSFIRIVILTVFILLPILTLNCQTPGEITDGKDFWFGIPQALRDNSEPVRWGKYPIELWISSKYKTKATISSLDGQITSMTYNISPNEIKVINIPDFLENKESEKVANKGIRVYGEMPIKVSVLVAYKWTGEAFNVLPVEALGTKYFTLNMYQDCVKMYSGYTQYKPGQILIIATMDGTQVTYYPKCETEIGIKKGKSGTANLNKGQTFLIKAKINQDLNWDWSTDLTGTKIQSNKPICVLSGHTKGAFPRFASTFLGSLKSDFMRNMLMDYMPPIEYLGTDYVSAPIKYLDRYFNSSNAYPDIEGDIIRFVATQDGTTINQMRTDGQDWKQISTILKEGEWFDILAQTEPAYYQANHPVLVGQYGKSWWSYIVGNKAKDSPQNPSWNGQGMMFPLTPVNMWYSYSTFRSVVGMDDFLYLTFKTADSSKIYFDGATIPARFGTSIKQIPGTDYSYIAVAIPAGDHYLKGVEGAKFAAYAYGNWDSAKDGFAYGYPAGYNWAIPCDNTIKIEHKDSIGNVYGIVKVEPADLSCAKINSITYDSLDNFQFYCDNIDTTDKKTANFLLKIIDLRLPASGKITAMDRAGNLVTEWFYYEPEQIVADPNTIDYGTLKIGDTKCVDVLLKNPGRVSTTIKELKFKYNKPEYKITSPVLPIVIAPGGQQIIQVCGTAIELSNKAVIDTIIAVTSIYEDQIIALKLNTNEPVVWIEDADWGEQFIGVEKPRTVQISNRSQAIVELFSMEWPDKLHFTHVEGLNFPISLSAGRNMTFTVYYKPDKEGQKDSTTAFFIGNTNKIKLYSAWNGYGITAGPRIEVTDLEFDSVTVTKAITKEFRINNMGINPLRIDDVKGPSNTTFTTDLPIINKNKILTINELDYKIFHVTFTPTELKDYQDSIVFSSNATKMDSVCRLSAKYIINSVNETSSNRKIKLILSPNPADNSCKIQIEGIEAGSIRLYLVNALGENVKNIYEGELSGSNIIYTDLSGLPAGVYFMVLQTPSERISDRLIIFR